MGRGREGRREGGRGGTSGKCEKVVSRCAKGAKPQKIFFFFFLILVSLNRQENSASDDIRHDGSRESGSNLRLR